MDCSPWGHKESDMTEPLSTAQHHTSTIAGPESMIMLTTHQEGSFKNATHSLVCLYLNIHPSLYRKGVILHIKFTLLISLLVTCIFPHPHRKISIIMF